jgi:hypothetical protein
MRNARQVFPSAAISPFGEVIVTWVDQRNNGGNDIYAQTFNVADPPGDADISNILVVGEESGVNFVQTHPEVAIGPNSYIVVWDDDSGGVYSVLGLLEILPSIQGRITGADRLANPLDTVELTISEDPQGDHPHWPKVSIDENSRIVVTWWDNLDGQGNILGRLYEPDGTPFTDPFLVTPRQPGASRFWPATDTRGDSIQFVFNDTRRALGWDVFTRRADWGFEGDSIPDDSTGTPVLISQAAVLPTDEGLRVQWYGFADLNPSTFFVRRSGPLLNPADPRSGELKESYGVAWLERAERLMGWTDHDVAAGESYAYWVFLEGAGALAGPILATYDPLTIRTMAAYPLPFADRVSLRLPPSEGRRTLEIYDLRGRRLWTDHWPGGIDPLLVTWDGKDRRGRPMPQGIYWARFRSGTAPDRTLRLVRLGR